MTTTTIESILFENPKLIKIKLGTQEIETLESLVHLLIPKVSTEFSDIYSYDLEIDSMKPVDEAAIIVIIKKMFIGMTDIVVKIDDSVGKLCMLDRFILIKFVDKYCSIDDKRIIDMITKIEPEIILEEDDIINMIIAKKSCDIDDELLGPNILKKCMDYLIKETCLDQIFKVSMKLPFQYDNNDNRYIVPLLHKKLNTGGAITARFYETLSKLSIKLGLGRSNETGYPEIDCYVDKYNMVHTKYIANYFNNLSM